MLYFVCFAVLFFYFVIILMPLLTSPISLSFSTTMENIKSDFLKIDLTLYSCYICYIMLYEPHQK